MYVYDSDATELVKEGIARDDIRVNKHLISYRYSIRKQYEEMMLQRQGLIKNSIG